MKKALFLHGTGGQPTDCWWPWLRTVFEESGYEVWAPLLPNSDRPNTDTYWKFLRESEWDFTNNIVVGHSSGATEVLDLLSHSELPKVKAAILVGVFLNENLTRKSPDFSQNNPFINLFPASGFDWDKVKLKSDKFYFVHGDNDPYCSYEDAKDAASRLDGELITVQCGGHLSTSFGITELPQLVEALRRDAILL